MKRGLAFEPSDAEFLLTGPFTPKELLIYRLLPNYAGALISSVAFLVVFHNNTTAPLFAGIGLVLFQIVCAHASAAAGLWGGSLPGTSHRRVLWNFLAIGSIIILISIAFIPSSSDDATSDSIPDGGTVESSSLFESMMSLKFLHIIFYPTLTPTDMGETEFVPGQANLVATALGSNVLTRAEITGLLLVSAAAAVSLLVAFRLTKYFTETSITSTERLVKSREDESRGRGGLARTTITSAISGQLPLADYFYGAGAILWKNIVNARRSRQQLILAVICTLLLNLPWILDITLSAKAPGDEVLVLGAVFLGLLPLVLQRTLPFDFRHDGRQLSELRTLPLSPLLISLNEIIVPALVTLALQFASIFCLVFFLTGLRQLWLELLLILFLYPLIALGVNAVWNLHYLMFSSKKRATSGTSGNILVVFMSLIIFVPAGLVSQAYQSNPVMGGFVAAGLQLVIDAVLIFALGRLFENLRPGEEM
jgi:hypothetical protein